MRQSAAGGLTRSARRQANVRAKAEVDNDSDRPSHAWSMLRRQHVRGPTATGNAGHGQGRSRNGNRGVSAVAPRLPLPSCTWSWPCKCTYRHYPERRVTPRRAFDRGLAARGVII